MNSDINIPIVQKATVQPTTKVAHLHEHKCIDMEGLDPLNRLIVTCITDRASTLKRSEIDHDELYEAKDLCADIWDEVDESPFSMGKLVLKLCLNNHLPIEYVGRNSANHALYRLK